MGSRNIGMLRTRTRNNQQKQLVAPTGSVRWSSPRRPRGADGSAGGDHPLGRLVLVPDDAPGRSVQIIGRAPAVRLDHERPPAAVVARPARDGGGLDRVGVDLALV
jgi:hypothetical protein